MASATPATSATPSAAAPRSRLPLWLAVACLLGAVWLAYANTLHAPFIFDDAGAVQHNPTIRRLDSLAIFQPPADGSTTTGRPLVNFSFALNYALSGETVWSYHATNLAIHTLAAFTLFGLVRLTLSRLRVPGSRERQRVDQASSRLETPAPSGSDERERVDQAEPTPAAPSPSRSRERQRVVPESSTLRPPLASAPVSATIPAIPASDPTLIAFLAALLWAVHPLLTESVTCIAQRTESLCGLFYLFTLYAFARGVMSSSDNRASAPASAPASDRARRRWLILSVPACALGMMAKEVMVTAPVLVFLYDRTFVAGSFVAAWRTRRGYYLALASTWLILLALLIGGSGSRGASAGFGLGITPWSYLLQQCDALLLYLRLSVIPYPLVLDYGTAVPASALAVAGQGIVVLALLAGTIWALIRRPVLGWVGACFFLVLAPSSSVVPLVTQTMAEHRMYLPLAGLVAAFVVAVFARFGRLVVWPALALIAFGLGLTIARNRDYRDAVTIWSDTVTQRSQNPRAHNNLAQVLQEAGRPADAEPHFARAVQLAPDYVSARYNYGVALLARERFSAAAQQLQEAVRLAPDHADAHLNLGNALVRLGRAAEAAPHYERALALQPGSADAHYNLGISFLSAGDTTRAATHIQDALRLAPGLAAAHYQLARLAEQSGDTAAAERGYNETLRLAPDHLDAHRRLGLMAARRERLSEAAAHFRAVTRLQPGDADAHANLGNVLLLSGQPREAIVCYEESLRLRPGDARTRENLQLARAAAK